MAKIELIEFKNKFAQLGEDFYSLVKPTGFDRPFLVSFNEDAAALIGLDKAPTQNPDFAQYFCGNKLIPNGVYLSSVYAGHQFGTYVPQLGDGRAILIGEANGYEVQLKGSGKTPYSRFGDGRAVLRSTTREYLCSEAMHNLGIPTTRALCIIGSDEDVRRERIEKGAMLTRLAPSHIRFGHFEYFYYTNQHDNLRKLADFVIKYFYSGQNYDEFFESVTLRTAQLIAQWQAVGFAHGVLNTDNMSILGLTIDYGPFGFLDNYDPNFICNHSDIGGRYAFDQQPAIGRWNLYALAQALSPLVDFGHTAEILKKYQPELVKTYMRLMRNKLGLERELAEDPELIRDILNLLEKNHIDYTNFFRQLSDENLRDWFLDREAYDIWFRRYETRLAKEAGKTHDLMKRSNPKYILRNYLAENAIQAATMKQDYQEIDNLLKLLRKPYAEQPDMQEYAKAPPEWGKHLEISCSS